MYAMNLIDKLFMWKKVNINKVYDHTNTPLINGRNHFMQIQKMNILSYCKNVVKHINKQIS